MKEQGFEDMKVSLCKQRRCPLTGPQTFQNLGSEFQCILESLESEKKSVLHQIE